MVFIGGLVGCLACGGIASASAPSALLRDRRPCRGTLPAGSASRLKKFRQGFLPSHFSAWPGARASPQERRPRYHVQWVACENYYELSIEADLRPQSDDTQRTQH